MSRLKFIGTLLALLCLGFIVQQVIKLDWYQISTEQWKNSAIVVFVGSIIYGLFNFSLSVAWWRLLVWSGEARVPARICHGIYGRAHLAKYLPGNIFSIVGRQILGRKCGLSNRALVWAAALEILGIVSVASLLIALGGLHLGELKPLFEVPVLLGCIFLPVFLPWVITSVFRRLPNLKPFGLPARSFVAYLRLYGIFLFYLPFFLMSAALLWWLLYEASGGLAPTYMIVVGISVGTWLAGYITPGATGGIGVRDALLILALKPFVGEAIVFAVLAFRLTTILGDIIYFLLALVFPSDAKVR
jgi:hypothetical protein